MLFVLERFDCEYLKLLHTSRQVATSLAYLKLARLLNTLD
jgi:hypothetical protein